MAYRRCVSGRTNAVAYRRCVSGRTNAVAYRRCMLGACTNAVALPMTLIPLLASLLRGQCHRASPGISLPGGGLGLCARVLGWGYVLAAQRL